MGVVIFVGNDLYGPISCAIISNGVTCEMPTAVTCDCYQWTIGLQPCHLMAKWATKNIWKKGAYDHYKTNCDPAKTQKLSEFTAGTR